MVIGLSAHISHILKPLNDTVFGTFKSYIQKELHCMTLLKSNLDEFDIAEVLKVSISSAKAASNVFNEFLKARIWDGARTTAIIVPLKQLQYFSGHGDQAQAILSSVEDFITSFQSTRRSLLRPKDVEDEGRIKISNRIGVHLTAEAILNAQKQIDERRNRLAKRQREVEDEQLLRKYTMDSTGDIRRW